MKTKGKLELTLGSALRARGISPAQLAQSVGLPQELCAAYASGRARKFDLRALSSILSALDCELPDILQYRREAEAEPQTLSTAQAARQAGVHPNTLRFYEEIGWMGPVPRQRNGYRRYGEKQMLEIRAIRCVMSGPFLQRTLRAETIDILKALAKGDKEAAIEMAKRYLANLEAEYVSAVRTASILQQWSAGKMGGAQGDTYIGRAKAASALNITKDTLRCWERAGLFKAARTDPGGAVYSPKQMDRLRVIKMLRGTGYGLTAIARSLKACDEGEGKAAAALNLPGSRETCLVAGDRWLQMLTAAHRRAEELMRILSA